MGEQWERFYDCFLIGREEILPFFSFISNREEGKWSGWVSKSNCRWNWWVKNFRTPILGKDWPGRPTWSTKFFDYTALSNNF